ncbi:MAG: potassium channel family protein [Sphingobacteriaceae bacterium]
MKDQLRKLFIGYAKEGDTHQVDSLKEHLNKIQSVWEGELYEDYGIERIFRLFLISAKLLFPGIYVKLIFSNGEFLLRKLTGEIYVIAKTVIPFLILYFGGSTNPFLLALNLYMLLETLIYIFNKIFVSEHETETAHRRSILLLFFNYIEVILAYAVIYSSGHHMNIPLQTYLDAIYFSAISGSTVGYGEIYPVTAFGKIVVICQTLTSVSFIVLFFNFFGSKIRD